MLNRAAGTPPFRPKIETDGSTFAAGLEVRDVEFRSISLSRAAKYRIVLPTGYVSGRQRYPVLYLLHGLNGDLTDWNSRTNLMDNLRSLAVIVVMPYGGNYWYTNSAGTAQDKFEDYIAKDLLDHVDRHYRSVPTRLGRAIAGISMGGYGALKFGLKYPGKFVVAGSFSGAQIVVHEPDFVAPFRRREAELISDIFGTGITPTRTANDIYELAKRVNPLVLPFLYITCGTEDELLNSNRKFVALLHQNRIACQYHEGPGAHAWAYWEDQISKFLKILSHRMDIRTIGSSTAPADILEN